MHEPEERLTGLREALRHDPLGDLDEAEEIRADLDLPEESGHDPTLRDRARAWNDRAAFDALTRIASSISANLDLRSLVSEILATAMRTIGGERGVLFLGTSVDSGLVPVVARSIEGKELGELEDLSRTVLRRATGGSPVQVGDVLLDPVLKDAPSIGVSRIRAVSCVPLAFRGQVRGVLYLDSRSAAAPLPEAGRRFLEAFASLASVAIENAELHGEILRENRRLQRRLHSLESFGRIVTINARMTDVLRQASLLAQAQAPLMIVGESGTGKELLARAIHEAGPRAQQPFIAHNCAAVPGELMESIFFGHVRGSFTGALRDAQGLFRLAHRGVLFLDEIAELDPGLQGKLLRVLEDGTIRPIGSDREVQVDVRVLTATNRDLSQATRDGGFREDLFYRASVLEIQIPPLRERAEDIPILVDHFIRKHAEPGSGRADLRFSEDALDLLQKLPWRGNVRELENLVQRVMILSPGPLVGTADIRRVQPRSFDTVVAPGRATSVAGTCGTVLGPEDTDRRVLQDALRAAGGNKSAAARMLGLHRNAFLRRMRRLGIDLDGPRIR